MHRTNRVGHVGSPGLRRPTDQFLPQGINSVQGLLFDNVTTSSIVAIRQCGPDCNGTSGWAALVKGRHAR